MKPWNHRGVYAAGSLNPCAAYDLIARRFSLHNGNHGPKKSELRVHLDVLWEGALRRSEARIQQAIVGEVRLFPEQTGLSGLQRFHQPLQKSVQIGISVPLFLDFLDRVQDRRVMLAAECPPNYGKRGVR